MSLKVKLKPIKQVYSLNGFKVLGCEPIGDYPEIALNQYGNFTLAGSNLAMIHVGEEYELDLRKNQKGKYKDSWVMVGFGDMDITKEGVKVTPEQELFILRDICDGDQPNNIHEAYPNFVQLILDGKEEEIDYHNIYNVGPVRFEEYVNKVKGYFTTVRYLPTVMDWGIESDKDIKKLIKVFATPDELKEELEQNPYHVFFDLLNFSFKKSDRYVLNKQPNMIDSKERCEFACLDVLRENESMGDTRLYTDLLIEMAAERAPECIQYVREVARGSERIYYDPEQDVSSNKATYLAEVNIAENIKERIKHERDLGMDIKPFAVVDGFTCTDEQKKILELANKHQICMLRGYGGSGKSTVMKSLVLMLEAHNRDYIQLAPTGKAAKRLRETTGRPASTIHMRLVNEAPITQDFVIVDEMSMVGVELLSRLFDKCAKETRFIFVCDEAQLASISCGNVVQDIIDSGLVPTATLTKIFRYGTSGLATVATDTREGHIGPRQNSQFSDYRFVPIQENPIPQILEYYESLLDKYTKDDIMVLSPFNKGPSGTIAINNAIQSRYNPNPDTHALRKLPTGDTIMFKVGDKVINTHNEYNMPCFLTDDDGSLVESESSISVMNGDIGYVRYIKETDKDIIMAVEFDTGMASIYGPYMNNLLLGYSISVHKSQGSEAKAVIVVTSSDHKKMLSSNLCYVADSRAKEQLIEIGDIETIKEGLKRHENKERETWLRELLEEDSI